MAGDVGAGREVVRIVMARSRLLGLFDQPKGPNEPWRPRTGAHRRGPGTARALSGLLSGVAFASALSTIAFASYSYHGPSERDSADDETRQHHGQVDHVERVDPQPGLVRLAGVVPVSRAGTSSPSHRLAVCPSVGGTGDRRTT